MKYAVVLFLYLAGAFLTGGYYSNHRCVSSAWINTCGIDSFQAGVFWPFYWAARGSIEVTK